jgi:hypothetical protein
VTTRPLAALFVSLACFAIVVGVMLGFSGRTSAFERQNPELFERLTEVTRPVSSPRLP